MFNRKITVGWVKDEKEDELPTQKNDTFQKKAATVAEHLQRTVVVIGKGILLYIAADTIRQVAIEKAKK